MPSPEEQKLRKSIRHLVLFFIFAIVLSGITTFPLESELAFFNQHLNFFPAFTRDWFAQAYGGFKHTNEQYPFISYGTDWLAFAHLIIAIAFIGPLRDPIKNKWIIQWGIICCLCVFPLALIAGHLRHVPLFWRLFDCSFGAIGFILIYACLKKIERLEKIVNKLSRLL